jgi:23S rRNA (cytosine1962-C5)-methyltransferase
MNQLVLKSGRDKSILRCHPWIFSGALNETGEKIPNGETVLIANSSGKPLATGAYSPHSQIRVRVWSFDSAEPIDGKFFERRISRAFQRRQFLLEAGNVTAFRIVNAESDGIPGLIVDCYGDYLVCQFFSAGVEYWKKEITEVLMNMPKIRGVYERSDADVRSLENLPSQTGLLAGEEPPEHISIREGNVFFLVDVRNGHKTGFYLDQRENRLLLGMYAKGKHVLNCYAYTGGFGIHALRGGAASVIQLDSSADALELAQLNAETNHVADNNIVMHVNGDVPQLLRRYRDEGRQFDIVILDPPKFAVNAGQVNKAARAYKDINLLAMKLIRPGGTLFTFSCSGHIDRLLFHKIIAGAAMDSGRDVVITHQLSQAADHPIATQFPEGEYLKGMVCSVE